MDVTAEMNCVNGERCPECHLLVERINIMELREREAAESVKTTKVLVLQTDSLVKKFKAKLIDYNKLSKKYEDEIMLRETVQRDCQKYEKDLAVALKELQHLRSKSEICDKDHIPLVALDRRRQSEAEGREAYVGQLKARIHQLERDQGQLAIKMAEKSPVRNRCNNVNHSKLEEKITKLKIELAEFKQSKRKAARDNRKLFRKSLEFSKLILQQNELSAKFKSFIDSEIKDQNILSSQGDTSFESTDETEQSRRLEEQLLAQSEPDEPVGESTPSPSIKRRQHLTPSSGFPIKSTPVWRIPTIRPPDRTPKRTKITSATSSVTFIPLGVRETVFKSVRPNAEVGCPVLPCEDRLSDDDVNDVGVTQGGAVEKRNDTPPKLESEKQNRDDLVLDTHPPLLDFLIDEEPVVPAGEELCNQFSMPKLVEFSRCSPRKKHKKKKKSKQDNPEVVIDSDISDLEDVVCILDKMRSEFEMFSRDLTPIPKSPFSGSNQVLARNTSLGIEPVSENVFEPIFPEPPTNVEPKRSAGYELLNFVRSGEDSGSKPTGHSIDKYKEAAARIRKERERKPVGSRVGGVVVQNRVKTRTKVSCPKRKPEKSTDLLVVGSGEAAICDDFSSTFVCSRSTRRSRVAEVVLENTTAEPVAGSLASLMAPVALIASTVPIAVAAGTISVGNVNSAFNVVKSTSSEVSSDSKLNEAPDAAEVTLNDTVQSDMDELSTDVVNLSIEKDLDTNYKSTGLVEKFYQTYHRMSLKFRPARVEREIRNGILLAEVRAFFATCVHKQQVPDAILLKQYVDICCALKESQHLAVVLYDAIYFRAMCLKSLVTEILMQCPFILNSDRCCHLLSTVRFCLRHECGLDRKLLDKLTPSKQDFGHLDALLETCVSDLKSNENVFESVQGLILISHLKGWAWVHTNLIVTRLYVLMFTWTQGLIADDTALNIIKLIGVLCKDGSCSDVNSVLTTFNGLVSGQQDRQVYAEIKTVLHLLGTP